MYPRWLKMFILQHLMVPYPCFAYRFNLILEINLNQCLENISDIFISTLLFVDTF